MTRFTRLWPRVLIVVLLAAGASLPGWAAQEQSWGGIGLQVVPTSTGELVVLALVENSPAAAAGVLPGDLIIAVDGFPLRGSDFAEVVSRHLWGPVGSSAAITLLRPGREGIEQMQIERISLKGAALEALPGIEMLEPSSGGALGEPQNNQR